MTFRSIWAGAVGLTFLAVVLPPKTANAQDAPTFECTLVIGYSQVREWYETGGVFESIVDDARWESKTPDGAGVDVWADPYEERWEAPMYSPCTTGSPTQPDRIVLGVSGPFGNDERVWADTIRDALALIAERIPSAERFELIPVAGGPEHGDCEFDGERVRASWQHEHIDNAIGMVVASDKTGTIVAGPSPHVETCSDYRDALGHLTPEAAERIGAEIASYYGR